MVSQGQTASSLTLIPWSEGLSATWDMTVTDTLAASYIAISSTCAASAAEAAAQRKNTKSHELTSSIHWPLKQWAPLIKSVKTLFPSWATEYLQ